MIRGAAFVAPWHPAMDLAYCLTIAGTVLRHCTQALISVPHRSLLLPAGISRLPDQVEFLVGRLPGSGLGLDPLASVLLLRAASSLAELRAAAAADPATVERDAVLITLGLAGAAGHLTCYCLTPRGRQPLQIIRVVAPGLPVIAVSTARREARSDADEVIWSRTIGALGDRTWHRLRDLKIAVIGCGRTGSLMTNSLARLGVRCITLVDPDRLEIHNVGEMDLVTLSHVSAPKTDALAEHLHRSVNDLQIEAVSESVLSSKALVALKRSGLFVSSVDNGIARLATAILAKLYLRPLVDIGTGIVGTGASRRMGADIRLVLPDRCLLCFGGLADETVARAGFLHSASGHESPPPVDWRQQRAGSLRSLNQTATGLALRLLEDFVAARLGESTWIHLDFDQRGIPMLESRSPSANPDCTVCRLAGRGDEGIPALQETLHAAADS